MSTTTQATGFDETGQTLPARPSDRLPPVAALPIIGIMSLAGWYAVWKLGSLLVAAVF